MTLPDELEERFDEDLLAYEQEQHMPYVTSVERRGIQKGLHQGLEQGLEKGLEQGIPQGEALILKRQLRRRFGELPEAIEQRLHTASTADLERWADQVLDAKTLAEVFEG